MSFWVFCLYYLLCSLILGLVLLFVYRLYVKKKCNILEDIALKTVDDYFNSYDNDDIVNVTHDINQSFNSDFEFPKKWSGDNANDSNR